MTTELNAAAKKYRSFPWKAVKDRIIGRSFQISVALVPEQEMRRVRRILRKEKKYHFGSRHALNVLSFLLDAHTGEILLNKDQIEKEAKRHKQSFRRRLLYLYIHGILHLGGYDHVTVHGERRMKREEEKWMKRFGGKKYKMQISKRKIEV